VRAAGSDLQDFDEIVLATGVRPRVPAIPGIDHSSVASYTEILSGRREAGPRVAILGMGGIGYDVAMFLCRLGRGAGGIEEFLGDWGVDTANRAPGGLLPGGLPQLAPGRTLTMLQRKPGRPGANLGLTTGWILKSELARYGVQQWTGVTYDRIDQHGLHCAVNGAPRLLEVDTIVICAGQESERELHAQLQGHGRPVHLVGGAREAAELDALAAIEDGTRLGLKI
jgi:2,4-dienoyl-CoA reductase (NADPH2)